MSAPTSGDVRMGTGDALGAAPAGSSVFACFRREKRFLLLTAVTGILYNVGMTAGPWFEGQLAQCLYDIIGGTRAAADIVLLSLVYVAVIAFVQGMRALKRLYVRKFANNVSRSLKEAIYRHLLGESVVEAGREDAGAVMTRAIADADACAEGMRKFTTEVFDTGVVMVAYLVMLFALDWRLTLLAIVFPPIAYVAAALLKRRVSVASQASKAAMSRLNDAAVDSIGNALTYRIYGEDGNRAAAYEDALSKYERANVRSGVWQNSPQPVYLAISMIGVIPILYLGGANVLGAGWDLWSIATFSTFLSCFTKLATKSSHAAKLFNAVQKAQVSWHRIEGYLVEDAAADGGARPAARPARLELADVEVAYGDAADTSGPGGEGAASAGARAGGGSFALRGLDLVADPGQIVGVTGRVASGKSTFGRLFLGELSHTGTISYGGENLRQAAAREMVVAYLGHDPELFTGTVRENVCFAVRGAADEERLAAVLEEVRIDGEVGPDTRIGMEGRKLSGGQQARLALARALYSKAPVLVLDDPFASVDAKTEAAIFQSLREREGWRTILLISHRIALFPQVDRVAFLEDGTMRVGAHAGLLAAEPGYRALFELQAGAGDAGDAADGSAPGALREGDAL